MAKYEPFDPTSDSDQIADRLRKEVVGLVLPWLDNPVFKALPPERALATVMSGLVTGTICACFSMILDSPEAHRQMVQAIEDYLPQAADHAREFGKV